MADAQSPADLRQRRTAAQLLADNRRRSPTDIVRHLLAVQAQDFAAVPLALRARSRGLTRSAVYAALDSAELVISWLNRGTLHLVCREDFAWLHTLTAPTSRTGNNRRLAQEGVTNPERAVRQIVKALDGGPLLRAVIGERVGLTGAALTHALFAASLDGVIVRGPVQGRAQTFILTRDHLGELPKVDRGKALAELGRRFQPAHPDATRAELAYWAGLPLRDLPDLKGRTHRRARSIPPKLLPPFDPYIIDWRDRSFAIPGTLIDRVISGGLFRAVAVRDGAVTGTWSRAANRVEIDAPDSAAFAAEAADVERFLA